MKIHIADGFNFLEYFKDFMPPDVQNFTLDSENPDFLFYSVFGNNHIDFDCVRIFFTGENLRADFNFCDYAIGFDHITFEDRYLRYPLYLMYQSFKDVCANQKLGVCASDEAFEREFCSFVVSNGKVGGIRDEFFDLVNSYKSVASGGKYRNNIGASVPDKAAFLKNYKFNIALENSSTNGYITEKIFDAKAAGTIPIYWGAPDICKALNYDGGGGLNPKAFVNLNDFQNLAQVLEFIKYLDNDKDAYLKMLNEPLVLDENHAQIFDERLRAFLANIFSQSPKRDVPNSAFRRGFGQWRMHIENRYKKYQRARRKANAVADGFKKVVAPFKKIVKGW